ncbi:hypothetical protein HW511_10310 [Asaia siamensis]|uniref:Filamentous hemagglutinin n=1 Tax=Asaia siamensis TaxID=110479 RepID=A0ABQ1M787_9PROT|nr:hypothetical protein [Asaia siamensis]GBR10117.1 hypothetical protein AA0323_2707 [Asaia siamensis NRIC 0323]GGC32674.1 hypothetical protein GCM10007207_17700 [Asaia siamensis]
MQYLVDRLGKTPSDYTFLGNSYFDQQYVQQQIVSATGQTFLGGTFVNASSQMQALVTNRADQAQRLGLTFGQALSDEQKASLTQNIVWYVPAQVNGATVLAPKLYLAPGNVALSGGTIAASDAALLSASNDITFNGGRLSSGGDLSMLAGNSLTLGAGTVRQATAVKGANVSSAFSQTQNYTSSISAGGNAVLAALGGDLKSAGAIIDSTGNMVLSSDFVRQCEKVFLEG